LIFNWGTSALLTQILRTTASHDVEAEIVYAADDGRTLVVENYGPGLRFTRSTGTDDRRVVRIRNARRLVQRPSLETNGFLLRQHRSEVHDFFDATEVRARYYRELERLIARVTGATRVMVFNHFLRCRDEAEREARLARAPVFQVHADYSASCGTQQVHGIAGEAADQVLAGRYAIIQAWQPIGRPAVAQPLALADARSVPSEDLLRTERRLGTHTRHIYRLRHNPQHRWFYFPNMRPDELVLFKSFDSETDGRARFVFHTSFEHPAAAMGAPPRQSIESRALAVFAR
jgi:hypothetical protein